MTLLQKMRKQLIQALLTFCHESLAAGLSSVERREYQFPSLPAFGSLQNQAVSEVCFSHSRCLFGVHQRLDTVSRKQIKIPVKCYVDADI